jgi:glutathione S-transferase
MNASPVSSPVLISHVLCPYVQRAAIVLAEKGVAFTRRDVDLAHKPDWFLQVSPLGKTPVLLVGGQALFESTVICEYLDETCLPTLHPADPLTRARHRAWMVFGSDVLNVIAALYNAPDEPALHKHHADLCQRFAQLEAVLGEGPYFAGERFSMVDAVFGPVFRYFDVIDAATAWDTFAGLGKVQRWRTALQHRACVQGAVSPDYPQRLHAFLKARSSALSRIMSASPPDPT